MEPIPKLQEDLKNPDPHFRQNAVIGLAKYFENEEARKKLKEEEKTTIVKLLLNCLNPEEDSVEVKARTVKIFKSISIHLKDAEIIQAFDTIVKYIVQKDATGKDIYVNCIKTILEKVPGSFYETIGKTIIPTLLGGLDSTDPEIIILCMETINSYIKTFDYELIKKKYTAFKLEETKIVEVALKNITSSNDLLKANSIEIIGTVGELLTKKQVCDTTVKLLDLIKSSPTILEKKYYILALKSLGHTSSRSQLDQLKDLINLLISYTTKEFMDSEGDYEEKNDMVEATLNCIEIYVKTSLNHIKESIPTIIDNTLELLKYDPGNTNEVENVEIEGYEGYEDMDYDANLDDTAWKVRRAASRLLKTIIETGFDLEIKTKEKIISSLIECFKEQEENTKVEIINCLNKYLDSLVICKQEEEGVLTFQKTQSLIFKEYIPKVSKQLIDCILKELEGNSKTIKYNTLKLLPTLAKVAPEGVLEYFNTLKKGIDKACFDSDENTLTFMEFLKSLFQRADLNDDYKDVYPDIIKYLKKGIANPFYKISTAAIEDCGYLFPILIQDEDTNKDYIMGLYNDILPKFKAQDIDFEIKIATANTISVFISECGGLLSEKEIIELFKVYISKTSNEMIRPEILRVLNDIIQDKSELKLKLDGAINELKKPILSLLETSSPQIQIKILLLLETIFKKQPNALKSSVEEISQKLLSLKIQEGLILHIFNILKNMLPLFKEKLINTILDHIENKFSEAVIDNSFLTSIFEFTHLACQKISKKDIISKVKKYSPKMKELNENMSYYFSIIICYSGEEKKFLDSALNNLSSLKDQKQIENVLQLIGDICENSKENHDEILTKLDKIKSSLGNKLNDSISQITGKIGANNPIGFINTIIKQKQDQDSRIALREFLNLIDKKNANITDANINGLIDWLLKTPKLEEEQINKYVGTCIGLVVRLNKQLIDRYAELVKENKGFKKASLLNGMKEIFKLKIDISNTTLASLYAIITEGIKDNERLIKEHSLQALNAIQYKEPKNLLDFYLKEDIRAIIQQSCKIDKTYIKEADFGGGNKIVEDKGVGIRKAALDIVTFMIDNYPNKIIFTETIPLLIECLLDTEDYLQAIVYSDLTKVAKYNSGAFSSYGGLFIDTLFKVWKTLKIEESKRFFSINVKNIFDELKDVESITGNPRYDSVVQEINRH